MEALGWKCGNNALFPDVFPHQEANMPPIDSGDIWRVAWDEFPFLARWTSNFDCGFETNWWFCICDKPINLAELKAKRRYEINKGLKYFEVVEINPDEYREQMFRVLQAALSGFPEKYRPNYTRSAYERTIDAVLRKSKTERVYGAFFKETGELCGYAHVPTYSDWAALNALRTNPAFEKYAINAALIYYVLEQNRDKLEKGNYYICDGQRNVFHETHMQDYLEKYFLFRKAYCRVSVRYNPKINWIVKVLYPFRAIFTKIGNLKTAYKISCVLKMEEINRESEAIFEESKGINCD